MLNFKLPKKRLIGTLAVLSLAFSAGVAVAGGPPTVERFGGTDRYDTNQKIITAIHTKGLINGRGQPLIIARGDDYADVLSASSLAGYIKHDVMIDVGNTSGPPQQIAVDSKSVIMIIPHSGVLNEDATNRVKEAASVIIMGGTGALPSSVETQILQIKPALAGKVQRIGGIDRYETASLAAQYLGQAKVAKIKGKRTVFLATGKYWADALIAGPAAFNPLDSKVDNFVTPILLSTATYATNFTKERIAALGIEHVVILGGQGVIGAQVESEIAALGVTTERIGGADRYDTATKFADYLTTTLGWSKASVGLMSMEDATDGADALVMAPMLGEMHAPALGVNSSGLPAVTQQWIANKAPVTQFYIFGGEGTIAPSTVTAAQTAGTK